MKLILCVKMFSHACMTLVLGYLSGVSTQPTTMSMPTLCIENAACYVRPDNIQMNWTDAQQLCKQYGSTLPIVSDPVQQSSFDTACINLTSPVERYDGVWIGAKAFYSDSMNWMWLDGSNYNGTVYPSQGGYQTGYSYVSRASTGITTYKSLPNNGFSYICYYPTSPTGSCINGSEQTAFYIESRCYVKYDAKMSWFGARNNCISNNGDLASFTRLSLLQGIIGDTEFWVGLRNNQWQWQDAVAGLSSDVTFTLWSPNQPDDAVPSCISTDVGDKFPGWRDWECTRLLPFICQVSSSTRSMPSASVTSTSVNPSVSFVTHHSDTSSPFRTPNHNTTDSNSQVNDRVVAVGIGIGIPSGAVIIALTVTVILQQRELRKLRTRNAKYQSEEGSKQNSDSSPSALSTVEIDASVQYEQLRNRNVLQEQQQYEQLPQSQT